MTLEKSEETRWSALESEASFDGLQQFFSCESTLANEGRLRRYLYVAEKPGES